MTLNVADRKQYITTVGYPDGYLDNQDCRFNFVAPSGQKILIFFEDVNLEKNHDFVVLRKYINESNFHTCIYFHNTFQEEMQDDGTHLHSDMVRHRYLVHQKY